VPATIPSPLLFLTNTTLAIGHSTFAAAILACEETIVADKIPQNQRMLNTLAVAAAATSVVIYD